MAVNGCPICLVKQRRIDELEEEVRVFRPSYVTKSAKSRTVISGLQRHHRSDPLSQTASMRKRNPRERGSVIRELVDGATRRGRLIA